MKKNIISALLAFPISALLISCSFAPVNNQYEKAGTLKKGNMELAGSYTGYSVNGGGESEGSNNNFGFRAGYGISDNFDLKLRYERLIPTAAGYNTEEFESAYDINYFSIVPKIAIIPEKFSFLVPLSLYSFKEQFNGTVSNVNFGSLTPQLIYTLSNSNNNVDLSFGLKADVLFGGGGASLLMGTTVGAGFSSDLSKWAIRPEFGASFLGGGAFLSYGIGFQFLLPKNKKG